MYVEHPLIAPGKVLRRDYQVAVAVQCTKRNTLVILPTGLGKTVIALLVLAARVREVPGKVLFLAPTKPLVEQHANFLSETFLHEPVAVFTGETAPEERELEWRRASTICSTPQVVQNDLVANRIDLKDVTCIVFDEAHRAVGNYAYGFIAERYREDRLTGLTLAMTASPGAKVEKIREVCERLRVEGVEARSELDADVVPYVQDVDVEWVSVSVPESIKRLAEGLKAMLDERIATLRRMGVYRVPYAGRKELLACQARLQAKLRSGEDTQTTYLALSMQAAALKLSHALELVETQGVSAFLTYVERLEADTTKAAKALLSDPRFREAMALADKRTVEHPKLRRVAVILRQAFTQKPDARVIVFTNYRDTAELLERELAKIDGLRPKRFVGQATRGPNDKGLSQKQQVDIVERFKQGEFNVLIATSVAEEGLDIPSTDAVIFYEPVASEIRTIQRRGRTGRRQAGRVVVLITKGTRDETYHYAARGREKKMRTEILALQDHFAAVNASEKSDEGADWFNSRAGAISGRASTLAEHDGDTPPAYEPPAPGTRGEVTILCDHREFASNVVRELSRMGAVVSPANLDVADYVLSDRVAVERKDAGDYATSLFDGRLFEQVKALRTHYPVPLLVVEGGSPGAATRASPESIHASLASIAIDFRVPILQSASTEETARLLYAIAKREQRDEKRPLAMRAQKGARSEAERLRFALEGVPRVSAVLSDRLLTRFDTLEAIVNASEEDLATVEGIGKKLAREIHAFFRVEYTPRPERGGSAPPGSRRGSKRTQAPVDAGDAEGNDEPRSGREGSGVEEAS